MIIPKACSPHVSSPFESFSVTVGSKEMPISLALMVPCENELSVTVGMVESASGDKVPKNTNVSQYT